MVHRQQLQRLAVQAEGLSPLRVYIALYLAALLVTVLIGMLGHFRVVPDFLEADEHEYYLLSNGILHGDFDIGPRRTLGFPVLLAAIRLVFDNFFFLQVVVAAIYALSAPLLFRLMRALGIESLPSLAASLIFIVWPPSLYFGTSLYSETVALPVFLLALSLLPSAWGPERSTGRAAALALLSGLVLGLAAHIRPMYLLFVPVAALILLVENRLRHIAWVNLGALLIGFAIVILPWSMMMEARFHRVILLSANGGETLAGGLNPVLLDPATQSVTKVGDGREAWVGPGKWVPPDRTGYLSAEELRLPYFEQDPLLRQRAVDWVLKHPADAIRLELCKAAYMWGLYPIERNSWVQILFGNVPLIALLLFSCYLFVRMPSSRQRFVRLWLLALYVTGIGLISWGSWRFRQAGDAGLIAYCTACGWSYWSRFAARRGAAIKTGETIPDGSAVRAT